MHRVTNTLDIKFLGSPQAFYGGRPLKFATRKALALLAYLVVEAGLQPREKLMALLWPESPTHLAQSALRNTLARLKAALRDVDAPLSIEADQIGFNFSSAYVLDLEVVSQALAIQSEAGDHPGAAIPPASFLLPIAAAAVRGPFLDGFSLSDAPAFDDWIALQRAAWGHRLDLIFEQLTRQQMEVHQFQAAFATLTRWIKLDDLNEAAYRRLMRLHFLNGDTAAALQTFKLCRDRLAQELGVEPAPRTTQLLAQIQSTPPVEHPQPASDLKGRFLLRIPFVGRAAEHQQLVQVYRLALASQVQAAVVVGESGIGKTRLADEFLGWVGAEGADVLRGRAIRMVDRLPYQAVVDALRERLERENAPEDLLDDAWLVELTPILPELRERYPDLPPVADDEKTSRLRLFEAVARLIQALAARRPLVWLIDDIQWADPGSLDLLHYLAQHWRESRLPILLLILLSQDVLIQDTTLRDWLTGLGRLAPTTHLALTAVSAAALQQLVLALAGEEAPGAADLAAWLSTETGGQPFFLAETLSTLDENGTLAWVSAGVASPVLDPRATMANLRALGSPALVPNIRDMILARLERLSQPATALLAATAVLNRSCTFTRLCQIAGIDELDGLNALDELLAARLVLEACDEPRPYAISHDRIREVVYTELHQARQQVYHRRALDTLTAAQAPAAELAYHALAAREWQAAFRYSLEAGDEALRLSTVTPAVQHYEVALNLLRATKVEADTVACQHLSTCLGRAYEIQERVMDAAALYEEIQALASAHDGK
jgi:DNA-binding SARP family transcriptional activator